MDIAKQTPFSYSMLALSMTVLAFGAVQGTQSFFSTVLFLLLLILGFIGATAFQLRKDAPEGQQSTEKELNIGVLAAAALVAFVFFNYVVPQITFPTSQTLNYESFFGQIQYSLSGTISVQGYSIPSWLPAAITLIVLIPNAEEQFFRGFWGNFVISRFESLQGLEPVLAGFLGVGTSVVLVTFIAALPGGGIFGLFHTPAYNGSVPAIVILSLDGTTMITINSLSGVMDTSILGHMGNNGISFFLKQSSILSLFLPPFLIPTGTIISPFVGPTFLVCLLLFKRRKVIRIWR